MIKRLLVFTFLLGFSVMTYGQADSLGIERKGDKVLVLHKVNSGQTLFALARRYGASVDEIRKENPILQQGLKVGQTIKIPYGKEIPVARSVSKPAKYHTVSAGETLYAISRKYNISVDDLKKFNELSSNALALGQKLIVEEAVLAPVEEATPVTEEIDPVEDKEVETAVEETPVTEPEVQDTVQTTEGASLETEVPVTAPEVAEPAEPVNYGGAKLEEVKEEGVAELIEEEEPTTKFLALHKTAKVGTVIKIRNLKNDLVVYVRVIGQIPDTADNENILIKVNKRAHDQLKAIDPKLRVELSYFH